MSNEVPEASVPPLDRSPVPTATDSQLLERFALRQDPAAFAELVRRHGSMVLAVCRRVLHHTQDAEDAFQATFLVLVRKAEQLDRQQPLATWLYTVAYHAALDARDSAARRRARENQAMSRPPIEPDDSPARHELRRLLDAELSRLPDKYRTPVVLCYLDGQTNEEAARQLGCPVGTLKVRLARAREVLRDRLSRRGLAVSVVLLADLLAEQATAAPVTPPLMDAIVATAIQYVSGTALTGASASAANLAEGVLDAMKSNPAPVRLRPADLRAARSAGGRSTPPVKAASGWGLGKGALTAVIGLTLLLGATLLVVLWPSGLGADAESILSALRTKQRDWWDNEVGTTGCKDPAAALARLRDKEQDWWEEEGLAQGGQADGAAALARLEALQRAWLTREGLDKGRPSADPAGALARLDKINRQWWQGEGLTRAKPDTEVEPVEAAATTAPPAANPPLADLHLKLEDKAGTRRFLDTGGTRESEEAVQLGLQWLAVQQQADGRWLIGKNPGSANWTNRSCDTTTTALALLPFLARGETHKGSQDNNLYTKQVEYGIKYLLSQQKPDGSLMGTATGMYTHALATIALCEDLGMTADPILKGPCQRAVDYIVRSQSKSIGGWRYGGPGQGDSDLSVSSWVLMALKSGQMAGLQIPHDTLDRAAGFVRKLEKANGSFQYQVQAEVGHTKPYPATMTAIGTLCRQYLQNLSGGSGDELRTPHMVKAVEMILANPPTLFEGQAGMKFPVVKRERYTNYYYWYYASYALLAYGGDAWKQWNPQMRDLIVSLQNKGTTHPALKGSWDPEGAQLLEVSGRTGVTALALLTLEVYYRHLPLNRPELGEMAKDLSKGRK